MKIMFWYYFVYSNQIYHSVFTGQKMTSTVAMSLIFNYIKPDFLTR